MIVDEINDLAMGRRQLRQAPRQNRAVVLFLQDRLRTLRVVGNFACDLLVERIIGAAAQGGQRLVTRNREYPGRNPRTPFKAPSVLPDVEKRVARKILGGGPGVHYAQHETVVCTENQILQYW